MSQHDLNIANQTAPNTRSDINNALQALGSNNSGATTPTTTFANMHWYDTSTSTLKQRSEADDAWISIGYFDQASNAFKVFDDTMVVSVLGAQTGIIGDQATSAWEAGTGTTQSLVSPANVKSAIDSSRATMIVKEVYPYLGDTPTLSVNVWNARVLNTVTVNEISGASLSSNQVTLPAGTYKIRADVPAFKVNVNVSRLYNITDGALQEMGTLENSHQNGYGNSTSTIIAYFTIGSTKTFGIDTAVQTGQVDGGGEDRGNLVLAFSGVQVYTQIEIEKTG
tara:strand:+ start:15 stop:857 length:843 start_codon:yes stop_codon:yes gene_type:complete